MHLTPISISWMKLVECSFADITQKYVRTGSFGGALELSRVITAYMAAHNEQPKPYLWQVEWSEILARIPREQKAKM